MPEAAALVRVDRPGEPQQLDVGPVVSIRPLPERGLALAASWTHVAGYGAEGLRWVSGRISWDGLGIDEIEGNDAVGWAWDPVTEQSKPFRLQLESGRHEGGSWDETLGVRPARFQRLKRGLRAVAWHLASSGRGR